MIKRLAASIREYKFTSILTPVLISCEVFIECIIPLIMANLRDYGIEPGNMDVVIRLGITLVVMSIVSLAFGGTAGYTCAYASAGFAKNLRHDLFYKVQSF
ncbi:MAG: ABC transporter ATP-binding protein, partial [Oscillospiraceae bacterium]|nr:ABC transporter ATP-binding protein [Oscillospiraceae bacterium]